MEIRTIETNKDLLYLIIEHLIYKSCVQVSAGPFLDGWKVSSILIHCGLGLSYSNLLLAFAGVKNQLDLRDECVAVIFLYFLIVFYSPQNGKGVDFFLSYGLISSHQCKQLLKQLSHRENILWRFRGLFCIQGLLGWQMPVQPKHKQKLK